MIQIRQATPEDITTIVQFQIAMAQETENLQLDEDTVTKGVTSAMKDATKGTYYIAKEADKVVGSLLTTYEWSDWRNSMVLWIQSVYVRPEYRRNKVFSLLYQYIKERVQSNPEFSGIRLYVDKSNLRAQGVYHAIGMNGDHYKVFEWMKTF